MLLVGSKEEDKNSTHACCIVRCCTFPKQAHQARQYTDTATFTLRCGVCQIGVRGEQEALQHAKQTGHQNFSEYH